MRIHGGTAAMYFSAILEYLTAEILELAANVSNDIRTKHITPRRVQLAIRGDEELHAFIKVDVDGAGIFAHLHRFLCRQIP
uniref:Histone H2A n=1 Tax=Glossina morsitans morsitans TaxID=37546 RepID=A0A1B0FZZ2_GLOMM